MMGLNRLYTLARNGLGDDAAVIILAMLIAGQLFLVGVGIRLGKALDDYTAEHPLNPDRTLTRLLQFFGYGAEHVWPRFLQVVQAHPNAARMSEVQIAQPFAEAVTAAIYIERSHEHGQIVREIVEVSPIVERSAACPSFFPLFRFSAERGLQPTGNRPMRAGFCASDLGLDEGLFQVQ